jgi:hypothetical protein
VIFADASFRRCHHHPLTVGDMESTELTECSAERKESPVRSIRLRARVAVIALCAALTLLGGSPAFAQTTDESPTVASVGRESSLLIYHQITHATGGTGSVGPAVLSADGTTAVFTDAPGTGAAETPNRIFTVDSEGGAPVEVDSYQTLCYCGSILDISDDGSAVISSDAVQLRIADGGGARELVRLASNEIPAISLSGDSRTVFFIVRRDTQLSADGKAMPRGVWAIDADGGNLRQIVSAEDVAAAAGATVDQTGCCFNGDGRALDVSSDGNEIVFDAYANGLYLFAVDAGGGKPRILLGPENYVKRVAISGDGATVGYDVTPPAPATDDNQIGVIPFAGGQPRQLAKNTGSGFSEPLQLTADGSRLLDSPNGMLYDTVTGDVRELAVLTPGAGAHTDLLAGGMPRGTMNADATRFLYVMRTIRCADCPNLPEQLARLDVGTAETTDAPSIGGTVIDPASVVIEGGSTATVSAKIAASGKVIAVGVVALDHGRFDGNVANVALFDDGTNGDAVAGDGTFSDNMIKHGFFQMRDDDTGPRTLRIQVEVESSDRMRQATAVDVGPLTVVAQ